MKKLFFCCSVIISFSFFSCEKSEFEPEPDSTELQNKTVVARAGSDLIGQLQ